MSSEPQKHLVILQPSGRRGYVEHGMSLRAAARALGVEIESICAENATCGKCKVLVEEGEFPRYNITSCLNHLSPVEVDEAAYFAARTKMLDNRGWSVGQVRLSCQAHLLGDVLINVPEESRGNKQIVRKSVSERPVEIVPAVRKYYIEMEPPSLSNPRGDWERMAAALVIAMQLVRRGETNLPAAEDLTIDYQVLRELANTLREAEWKVTVTLWMDREVIRVQPGYVEDSYGVAVDIGSTTIAAYLCDLRTGEVVAAESEMNPQIVYGEDIMSRIHYTMNQADGLAALNHAVVEGLNKIFQRLARHAKIKREDILEVVLVGNTTMHHLVLNLPPRFLGLAPYVPTLHRAMDIKARELGIQVNQAANVHLLPIEASFVGADNMAVLIAEEPYNQDEQWLIIDVGTNAELVLGNRHRLLCTSTPTGPAFEGAHVEYGMRAAPGAIERVEIDSLSLEPRYRIIGVEGWSDERAGTEGSVKGICGSAIIDAIAEMFRVGILQPNGTFTPGLSSPRIRQGEFGMEYVLAWAAETSIGRDIPITMRDVRQIQLAKAALYVAAKILLREMGIERPDRIILAGGFGSYIDKTKAMILGMIPDCPLDKVYAIGNAAGDGARIALLNHRKRREAVEVANRIQRVELPIDPDFQNQFMLALNFPHMVHPFQHIEHLLPLRVQDPKAIHFMEKSIE
ncbi:MAG TPA: ASKHA domain-containing protein [Anaerolineae bacterium]|nr:ASKHA domain-containing protein [Anaerolineae bacterium]